MAASQSVLFSEPLYTETGVWCELAPDIDPAQWAGLCRHIGTLSSYQFRRTQKKVLPNPDSIMTRLRRIFCFEELEVSDVPLVCLGPEGPHRLPE
jgi:hypothetical protein